MLIVLVDELFCLNLFVSGFFYVGDSFGFVNVVVYLYGLYLKNEFGCLMFEKVE